MKKKYPEKIELGLIPCKKCGERHVLLDYGKNIGLTWRMNGHDYHQIEPRKYIQMQRDEYNEALKTIRKLKSKIWKLEKKHEKRIPTGKKISQ